MTFFQNNYKNSNKFHQTYIPFKFFPPLPAENSSTLGTSVQSSKWKRGGIYDISSGYYGKEENIQENNFCYVATIPAWEKHAEKNRPTVTHWTSMSFFLKILLTWGYLNKWGLLLFVHFISLWHGEAFFAAIPPTGLVRI